MNVCPGTTEPVSVVALRLMLVAPASVAPSTTSEPVNAMSSDGTAATTAVLPFQTYSVSSTVFTATSHSPKTSSAQVSASTRSPATKPVPYKPTPYSPSPYSPLEVVLSTRPAEENPAGVTSNS